MGCGIVGAMIAYELSQLARFEVTVLDKQPPAQGATGAALGLLMGIISRKVKGRNWRLRETSLIRYDTLLPELEAATGCPVPQNRQGLLSLSFDESSLPRWRSLCDIRQRQGWPLEIWSPQHLANCCPYLNLDRVVAGIYSPRDRQIAPKDLTYALVKAAQQHDVDFHFDAAVTSFQQQRDQVTVVETAKGTYAADWVVITAGLGSQALTQQLEQTLPLIPVLGQGIRIRFQKALESPNFRPVINGDDVHLVPLSHREYAVAATVEFPEADQDITHLLPQEASLAKMWQSAIGYCPALQHAEILNTWHGLRPRPQSQAAPVVQLLEGYRNVVLATGHYRNGVMLAPATAELVKNFLI